MFTFLIFWVYSFYTGVTGLAWGMTLTSLQVLIIIALIAFVVGTINLTPIDR